MAGYIVIDRIENGAAACEGEGRRMFTLPLERLPPGSRAGDCLREEGGGLVFDADETLRRREQNLLLLRGLTAQRKKYSKGD